MPRPVNLGKDKIKQIKDFYKSEAPQDAELQTHLAELTTYETELDTDEVALKIKQEELKALQDQKVAEINLIVENLPAKKGAALIAEDRLINRHYQLVDAGNVPEFPEIPVKPGNPNPGNPN